MQAVFVELPEIKVAGLGARFISILSPHKNNMQIIPALWHAFVQRQETIPHKTGQASLGLVEMLPDAAARTDPAEMYYIACAPVATFDGMPADLVRRTLPAGRYARFTHKGKLDGLHATMHAIYRVWAPQSGAPMRDAPHIEWYDQRFDPGSDASEFDVYVPVK